jgi:transposase InsO family protein
MARNQKPPSQSWRTFLDNHVADLASMDFFTVPTATFRVLLVFIVLHHDRRQIVHFNVTEHPTAHWIAKQIRAAFPFDIAPRCLVRDRDRNYGDAVQRRIRRSAIDQVPTAPRSPWQNPFVERVIGPFAGIVWITSSCSMSDTCAGSFASTSTTTLPAGRIDR